MRETILTAIAVMMLPLGNRFAAADDNRGLPLPLSRPDAVVSPLLDDAGLNDVQLIGQKHAWAVGDRGVIWQSQDGGRSWTHVPSPAACSLNSVCFLTDRVGWIVGGSVRAHGEGTKGVVLHTTDGGKTWTRIGGSLLPLLHDVQFFDLNQGMAVGESTSTFPTGVLTTADGGKTWQSVNGPAGDGWRCAAFLGANQGFVAGQVGRYATVAGGQLQPSPAGASGLRGITDVAIGSDLQGWLAGDGGLILQTKTGGITWNVPQGALSRTIQDAMDFCAVAVVGDSVWLAGQPGTVVWHSADQGETWANQQTGGTPPLRAIDFSTDTHGCAVGALGQILLTIDGGKNWQVVRGTNRRAALLMVHAHESSVSLNVTTKYGNELGYRSVAAIVARRDIGPDGDAGRTLDIRLHEAITTAGGADSTVDWAFPIAAPGLNRDQSKLVEEWELLTDNRLREKMLARLVALLCSWRPDVVIVDEPGTDDAATKLLSDAMRLAILQAARPTEHGELQEDLNLPTWEVTRLFRRLPSGSGGAVILDAHEFLPRLGKSLAMAAAEPYRLLAAANTTVGKDESFAPMELINSGKGQDENVRDLFTGITLTPGGEARRELQLIDDDNFDRLQELAQQQRNFAAYSSRMMNDTRHAAQLIGQTKDIIAGAPADQAAVQLFNLAGEYRRRGEWEHAQAIFVELVQNYPEQPAAVEAMCWLLPFWSSAEVGWQRLRDSLSVEGSRHSNDGSIVQANVLRAIEQARASQNSDETLPKSPADSAVRQASATGQVRIGGSLDQRVMKRRMWLTSADRLAETLARMAAPESQAAQRQFLIAALHRKQDRPRLADEIYRKFLNETAGGPWNLIAAGEMWLVQPSTAAARPTAVCRRAQSPPILDGFLDDDCWQRADALSLLTPGEHLQTNRPYVENPGDENRATVMWAYDGGFLYVAARVPRAGSSPNDQPELAGRKDDADLSLHDRLSFAIDTDRDYATFYEIAVDQRGWSADACWENRSWNGQRFIAAEGDDGQWRIEMAIPFQELVPQPPSRGDTWAAGVTRVMPTIGVESWTHPSGSEPRPEGFGLLRFD